MNTTLAAFSQLSSRVTTLAFKPFDYAGDVIARSIFRVFDLSLPSASASTQITSTIRAPGPLSFIQSGFALSLIVLAVLVNRITHLVPPRRPALTRLSPVLRFTLRLPSLLLLLRAIMLLATVLAVQGGWTGEWFKTVGTSRAIRWSTIWAGTSVLNTAERTFEDSQVLWEVFVATAVSTLSETFVRSLDDDLTRQATFNLLSFSFLLHIHSTPIALPSLPSVVPQHAPIQLYYHLVTVLCEIFLLHLSFSFTPPLPPTRLLITFFFSLIGQSFIVKGVWEAFRHGVTETGWGDTESSLWLGTAVWMHRAPEMAFEAFAAISIALRFLAAVIRREEISIDSIFGHSNHFPRLDRDFAGEMIKYGSACLSSTRLAGLANEVTPIPTGIQLFPSRTETEEIPTIYLPRSSNSSLEITMRQSTTELEKRRRKGSKGNEGGLRNEIVTIDVERREDEDDAEWRQDNGRHITKFFKLLFVIGIFVVRVVYRFVASFAWRIARKFGYGGDLATLGEGWKARGGPNDYDDVEDVDYSPGSSSSSSATSEDEEDDDEDEMNCQSAELEDAPDEVAPTSLYSDLSLPLSPLSSTSQTQDQNDLTPVLLAHHLAPSGPPLTRRRYNLLTQGHGLGVESFSSALEQRRRETTGKEGSSNSRGQVQQRMCVVCTVEERTIICWPCRCLSLCEDCRDNLAERTLSSAHLCPTCRSPVKGFSRIFIP